MTGTAETPQTQSSVDTLMESTLKDIGIPPRPAILERISSEMLRDDPDYKRLATIIGADVSLSAGLIKTANSPFFGYRIRARTINEALMLLGLDVASRTLAGIILLQYLLQRVSGSMRIFRPRVMISVPYGVTSVERRAVYEAVLEAGSREAYLIQQPLAAALGVDLPINSPSGNMVITLGGGCTEAAVMAMYSIVSAETLRAGGIDLDEAIVN